MSGKSSKSSNSASYAHRLADAIANPIQIVPSLRTVMLVEDHLPSLKAMSRFLRQSKYAVYPFTDFESAVRWGQSHTFDLLMTDLQLPTHSGWELFESLTKKGPVSAIAISACCTPEEIQRSTSVGFLAHLTKPVDLKKLEQALALVPHKN